jgi:diguanylate cyclase (GGDEF)-like protein
MGQLLSGRRLESSRRSVRRLLNSGRWLAGRRYDGDKSSAVAFGIRLLATLLLTFAVVGTTAFVLVEHNLAQRQIDRYAGAQRADAKALEAVGVRAPGSKEGMNEIYAILDSVGNRPGTLDASLVNQRHVITRAMNFAHEGEVIDNEPRLDAALEHGRSYAGHEDRGDRRNFEFITPVNLPGGRYAYDVTYDHRAYDAQVNEVRKILALVGLLALVGGGGVFYLVGGRRLMRDHRTVLRQAVRDGLTDLPNQRAFAEEFPRAVASAERYQDTVALVLLDIDDFKLINDRHGHPQGDAVLKRVGAVLHDARAGDSPYRIGGDEFALLLAHVDAEGARIVVRRLSRALAEAGIEVSIGISGLRPGLQADTLRAEADAALYEAKRREGSHITSFEEIRARVVVTTSQRKEAVRRLIDEGRLTTVFQPIWNLGEKTLLGIEALTRPDASYGLSGPAEAFDIAEQLGRVHQLDVLCVENALRSVPSLDPGVLLFLNLSPLTLDLDSEADSWLAPLVERTGLQPRDVVVEVTERFGGRSASVVKRLKQLRRQGFKIAIDDVGTGNSGLEMLRSIEAEFVKLDRSVVASAATEPGARAVLMAMATFARQTGAFVIAEGVEDEDTLEFLRTVNWRDLSSDAVIQGGQGFGLGRPSDDPSSQRPAILRESDDRMVSMMDARHATRS